MRRLSMHAWRLLGSFSVIVVSAAALLVLLNRGGGMCGNDVISERVSPDGKWKAVVFVVDCGATTTAKELAPRVSLLRAGDSLSGSDSGNIFGLAPTDKVRRPDLQLDWAAAHELKIGYPAGATILKQAATYKDLTITYVVEK